MAIATRHRANRASPRALLALALASALAAGALGCSTVNYVTKTGPKHVASARTMDFYELPGNEVTWVPAGIDAELTPVDGDNYSSLGATYRVKYPFVCLGALRDVFASATRKVFNDSKLFSKEAWPGGCPDGMNTKGLAIGYLWQGDTKWWPSYSQPGSPAVAQWDAIPYLLANFANVSEVKAAFDAGLQIVTNSKLDSFLVGLFNASYLPAHYSVMDAQGNSLVLEMQDGMLKVYDKTVGVLTNEPLYPQQVQRFEAWQAAASQPPLNYTTDDGENATFFPLPGSYSSPDRFTRLAMLKKAADTMVFPKTSPLRPGVSTALPHGSNRALVTVMDMIQAAYLPVGVNDAGGYLAPGAAPHYIDWTIWATLRDHTAAHYYYRTANTPQWSVIKLDSVAWPKHVESVLLGSDVWWRDVSDAFRKPSTGRRASRRMLSDAE